MKWPAKQRSFFVNTQVRGLQFVLRTSWTYFKIQGVLTANMADIMRMSSATLQAKMAQPATLATLKVWSWIRGDEEYCISSGCTKTTLRFDRCSTLFLSILSKLAIFARKSSRSINQSSRGSKKKNSWLIDWLFNWLISISDYTRFCHISQPLCRDNHDLGNEGKHNILFGTAFWTIYAQLITVAPTNQTMHSGKLPYPTGIQYRDKWSIIRTHKITL